MNSHQRGKAISIVLSLFPKQRSLFPAVVLLRVTPEQESPQGRPGLEQRLESKREKCWNQWSFHQFPLGRSPLAGAEAGQSSVQAGSCVLRVPSLTLFAVQLLSAWQCPLLEQNLPE